MSRRVKETRAKIQEASLSRLLCLYLVACILSLASCGFHLRGSVSLPPELAITQVRGGSGPVVEDLRHALEASGAELTEDAEAATAVIEILRNSTERRVLSVNSAGKVQEYELHGVLQFRVQGADGRELLPAQQVQVTRDFLFDPDDVLGKSSEEQLARREMQRDLVNLMMLRLQAMHAR